MSEKQIVSLYLKHDFTPAELDVMHKRLALQTTALRHKESEKKSVVAQFTSQIEAIDSELGMVSDKINTGSEYRNMDCQVVFDWEKGTKDFIHPETGEVAKTEDITSDDRQRKLKLEQDAVKARQDARKEEKGDNREEK